jgi:hypothetical protein
MLSLIVAGYCGGGVGASFVKRRTTGQPDEALQRVSLKAEEILEEFYLSEESIEDVVVMALSLFYRVSRRVWWDRRLTDVDH